jgi:mannan endo-1,4-beta-mannosidase
VTPNASSAAVELLKYIHSISGKQTLVGQHSAPLMGSTRLGTAFKNLGHYPALFGQDFGFAAPGDWDGINFRQRIVDEAILRHAEGFIITLMWHAVRPFEDEPVAFLDSVSGKISDEQWHDLITPGTICTSDGNHRWT